MTKILKKPQSPCTKDCASRTPRCHIDCEKYILFEKQNEEYRQEIRRRKLSNLMMTEYDCRRSTRKIRHLHSHKHISSYK